VKEGVPGEWKIPLYVLKGGHGVSIAVLRVFLLLGWHGVEQ
jgi:hypothetical protein